VVRLYASACIEAPAATVWAHLARLEDIQLWSAQVVRARCEGPVSRGVGAERTCDLVGNLTITERWIAWDEGRSFTYEGSGIGLMKRAVNRWSVISQGERTLLTSEAEVAFVGGVFSPVLAFVLAPLLRRMAPNALASFKYLVEHGTPYSGKASALPRPAPTC
jgi:hypothetical protein